MAHNKGMWVSQMIRIATPFEIGNGVNHVTQVNAITKSVQPLACLLSGVALWLDAGDEPATASSAGTKRGILTGRPRRAKKTLMRWAPLDDCDCSSPPLVD